MGPVARGFIIMFLAVIGAGTATIFISGALDPQATIRRVWRRLRRALSTPLYVALTWIAFERYLLRLRRGGAR